MNPDPIAITIGCFLFLVLPFGVPLAAIGYRWLARRGQRAALEAAEGMRTNE